MDSISTRDLTLVSVGRSLLQPLSAVAGKARKREKERERERTGEGCCAESGTVESDSSTALIVLSSGEEVLTLFLRESTSAVQIKKSTPDSH